MLRLLDKKITGLVVFNTFPQQKNTSTFMKPILQLSLVYFMAYRLTYLAFLSIKGFHIFWHSSLKDLEPLTYKYNN